MLSFQIKKKILVVLISSAIILLAADILLQPDLFNPNVDKNRISVTEISERFRTILSEFGIENRFIKETKSVDNRSKNEILIFKIQVPQDLTIPEILQQVYNSFGKDSLTINSVEKIKGGKSQLTFEYDALTLIKAEFNYAKNYARNKGYLGFIIKDIDAENQATSSLIESSSKLNFLIRPETNFIQYCKFITHNSQQFSVLIDDDISEQKYQLASGFSEQRVINVVKTLVTDFQKAVCFIADANSEFYKSTNYEIFKRELSKRKIKLFKTTDFVNLKNDESMLSSFNETVNSLGNGESVIFLLNVSDYLLLNPDLKKYKMKGYKVINSSLLFSTE